MENSYFHFAVKIEINRLRSAKLSEKESLAGYPKQEAPRLDAMSAHFIFHSKKSLNCKCHSKPWHMISLPSLKDSHIKKKTNNQTTTMFYCLVKLFRLHRFFCSLIFLVQGYRGTWTVVTLSQWRSAEDLPMQWKGANKTMQINQSNLS